MNPLLMSLLLAAGLGVFAWSMFRKTLLLKALGPAERTGQIGRRLKNVLVMAIGQKRLAGRKKERMAGVMHALIFWGFCILLIRSVNLYGEGFVKGFELPLLGHDSLAGYVYLALKDIMEAAVLLMVFLALFRRAVLKPERLHNTWEAYLVLVMIAVLMVSDLLYDGARQNLITLHQNPGDLHFFSHPAYGAEFAWTPVSAAAAALVSKLPPGALEALMVSMFWSHIAVQLLFLNFLPYGKHFHVITALPNVFFKSLGYPHEKPQLLDLEDEDAWENETLGLNHIHQLSWKQGLDLYTCAECGRCKEVCPAHVTEKPLNLHDFNDQLKHELFRRADPIIERSKLSGLLDSQSDPEKAEEIKARLAGLNSEKSLVGDVISPDTLWACVTCRACEEVCPAAIEQVPRIIAMRQGQTLMAEAYPSELNAALKGLERNGNPWGIGYDKRADWAEGLDIPTMAENSDVEYLFWVGCAGSFDDRSKKISAALARVLKKAGVSFAILGAEEKCAGDFARRAGNEMLFQMMALENIETLSRYNVKKIVTACPHCLNALKHDYPQLGGRYEVVHHSSLIHDLAKTGRISLERSLEGSWTYHDPCYLGRYQSVYEPPRSLVRDMAQDGLLELPRHGKESFCCGAGGARMWMEESIGKRINLARAEEIAASGADHAAAACPFCMTMLEDGMKEMGKEDDIQIRDIAEIVAEKMV
ncbi:conserved membrane hypothetical protein [Candidatus Desulfarcum epimagneticum]|uniref:4Fe-4S ferredoxin-type domain-containing protein n=1 Tax=uncultured Desulfobacteraceae bacterium TaxID=218296 RepID=A0A484HE98_9BACT|nr:conserved membrane hypothetical protein [uncultured Desulfobacteraceae bacterium]